MSAAPNTMKHFPSAHDNTHVNRPLPRRIQSEPGVQGSRLPKFDKFFLVQRYISGKICIKIPSVVNEVANKQRHLSESLKQRRARSTTEARQFTVSRLWYLHHYTTHGAPGA